MSAYYNEIDPYAAAWLRNLIAAGHIAPGDVDERSIADVAPDDLRGYTQCHFFAGIGGWSHALRRAEWCDERPVWTGSCPCQPFSSAGKGLGTADERHLWPQLLRLIAECGPSVVFGEQVASADGRRWLAGVRADLEALGYAVGAADLCAACVGAPHIRQRLWWVADAGYRTGTGCDTRCDPSQSSGRWESPNQVGRSSEDGGVADTSTCGWAWQRGGGEAGTAERGSWSDAVWLPCADGKARRIEPGLEPLAHGVPNRVGRIRAYGNAIVPQVAEAFIQAYIGA